MKKTILIFGASSFLGSNLVEVLKDEYRIIGTYYKTPVALTGTTFLPCNVLKKDQVTSIVGRFKPDVIIYAVGLNSIRKGQLHPKLSEDLNSNGAINCAVASDRYGCKFIYFSNGFVFKSRPELILESDTPLPDTIYGQTLCSGEFHLQRSCMNYLILRSSTLYGRSYHPLRSNWFDMLQYKLAKQEEIEIDDLVVTGFLDIQFVANVLKELINKGVTNKMFHLSSSDYMTRFKFAKTYARVFKKDENLIKATMGVLGSAEEKLEDKQKMQFKLDHSGIQEFLNIRMPDVEESLNLKNKVE